MGKPGREQGVAGAGLWEDGVRHLLGLEASPGHLEQVILKSNIRSDSHIQWLLKHLSPLTPVFYHMPQKRSKNIP